MIGLVILVGVCEQPVSCFLQIANPAIVEVILAKYVSSFRFCVSAVPLNSRFIVLFVRYTRVIAIPQDRDV
jgi:hypothetical protein